MDEATRLAYLLTEKPKGYFEAEKALAEGKRVYVRFSENSGSSLVYQLKYLFNPAVNVITWFDLEGCSYKFYSTDSRYELIVEDN